MRETFKPFMDFICSDLRKTRAFDLEHNPVHRLFITSHNFFFLLFIIGAVGFFVFLHYDGGASYAEVFEMIDFGDTRITAFLNNNPYIFLYSICFHLMLVIALPVSVYFYIKYGSEISRSDLSTTTIFGNVFITQLYALIMSFIGVLIMFFGGMLIAFGIPDALYLSHIPGFIIIQLVIAFKILSIGSIGAINFWMILFPYSLHPRISLRKS